MKTKKPQSKSRNKQPKYTGKEPTHWGPWTRFRVIGEQPQCNSVQYRAKGGRHIVTLDLGEGAFSAIRAVAHAQEQPTPEAYILDAVCDEAAQMLTQLTTEEAAAFVKSGEHEYPRQTPVATREIIFHVTERAYTILAGEAAQHGYTGCEGYDPVAEMLAYGMASLHIAQEPVSLGEKRAQEMFLLPVTKEAEKEARQDK
jgi:hypothetical protein